MVKELNGRELVGFVKERQAHLVQILRSNKKRAKLVIIRDSDNPVIEKYVKLKRQYGEDIGVEVVDAKVEPTREALVAAVTEANLDETVSGIIVQLPLVDREITEEVVSLIQPEKDVDGLSGHGRFDSATATAINWLLTGYNIDLVGKKIAVVGRGKLVAGTASEGGKLVGDISDEIRERSDISAITPKLGGVGPLTVGVLFENVLAAAGEK